MVNFFSETKDGVVINVKAQPRSSRAQVSGLIGDKLKVCIRAAPVDGKANRELIEAVADAFNVAKSRVEFVSGETSKAKRILVHGVKAAEAIAVAEKGFVR